MSHENTNVEMSNLIAAIPTKDSGLYPEWFGVDVMTATDVGMASHVEWIPLMPWRLLEGYGVAALVELARYSDTGYDLSADVIEDTGEYVTVRAVRGA